MVEQGMALSGARAWAGIEQNGHGQAGSGF